jgi:outer membrane lipoprotein carrier protein
MRWHQLLLPIAAAGLVAIVAAPLPAVAQDAPAPPPAKEKNEAIAVAERVQDFYDKTKTFQASFKQSFKIKVQNVTKTSKGKVVFAKPGKLSFRYTKPDGNRVVSDGKTVRVYEKEDEQMYETKVDKSQYPAALAFLMGKGKLVRDFKLRLLDAAKLKVENGYVLEGVPKEASPAYKKILLYVDAETAQVRRVLILDAQGNRNRFDFRRPVLNEKIDDSEFVFNPPPGTNIISP